MAEQITTRLVVNALMHCSRCFCNHQAIGQPYCTKCGAPQLVRSLGYLYLPKEEMDFEDRVVKRLRSEVCNEQGHAEGKKELLKKRSARNDKEWPWVFCGYCGEPFNSF